MFIVLSEIIFFRYFSLFFGHRDQVTSTLSCQAFMVGWLSAGWLVGWSVG